jgi:hypothetical protein
MFTGFASENTPAIQVWNFLNSYVGVSNVSLTDDCAPIQYFKTGGNDTEIRVFLPSAPIEGKIITIINQKFNTGLQLLHIRSSEVSGNGTNATLYSLGVGSRIDFVYSKQFITFGPQNANFRSGWVALTEAPLTASNYGAVSYGGNDNHVVGNYAANVGGSSNRVNGAYCSALGGQSNTASSSFSTCIGGSGLLSSGSYSATMGGTSNTASATLSAVVGGSGNTASAQSAGIFGGQSNNATSSYCAVLGGELHTANSFNSTIISGSYGTTRSIVGIQISAASRNPIAGAAGVSQSAMLILGRQTTDATATRLTSNTSAAATTNQVILPNNSAYTFQGTCIANVTAGGTTSGWKFEGVIKRGANAASTVLVAAVTPTVIAQDAGAAAWVLAITADTTNGGIAVTVTGQAATTIRWVCRIETTEVTY